MSITIDRRRFLLGSTAFGALAIMHPYSVLAAAGQAHLRIMETTDIHVNLLPYDYYADKPNDTMGLSRTATIIQSIRDEATNSMLIDNGDLLQGSPMGDYIAYEKGMKDGDVHPIMKGMNLLGYECSTFGNHEFNYGLSFFDKVIAGANFPFVCANLVRGTVLASNPRDDKLYAKPYIILDKKVKDGDGKEYPIRIGIIGFVPPQIMIWDSEEPGRQRHDPRHRRGGQGLGAADQGRRRRHRHRARPFRHRRQQDRPDGERLAVPRRRPRSRRHHDRPPAPGLPRRSVLRQPRRRRQQGRHADGQAGGDGRLLGLAYGPHRPAARARRQYVEGGFGHVRGAADLQARRTARSSPRSPTTRRSTTR